MNNVKTLVSDIGKVYYELMHSIFIAEKTFVGNFVLHIVQCII